jgi:hypothetical protein
MHFPGALSRLDFWVARSEALRRACEIRRKNHPHRRLWVCHPFLSTPIFNLDKALGCSNILRVWGSVAPMLAWCILAEMRASVWRAPARLERDLAHCVFLLPSPPWLVEAQTHCAAKTLNDQPWGRRAGDEGGSESGVEAMRSNQTPHPPSPSPRSGARGRLFSISSARSPRSGARIGMCLAPTGGNRHVPGTD